MPDRGSERYQQMLREGVGAQQTGGTTRPQKPIGGPVPAQGTNPWQQYGLDPLKRQASGLKGNFKQASEGLNYYAQQRGKTINQDQWNQLGQHTGYKGDDQVTGEMYNKGMDWLDSQWDAPAGAPPPPPPSNPQVPTVDQLGPTAATQQWQKQAPAAGVPSSFRGMNPYYAQQQGRMQKILANPETMGQQWQDRQNEAQKESAQRMMRQSQAQGQQALAGRGFGAGGGTQQALQNQGQQQMMQQILSGRRDTAQKAAQINRQDEYNALDASQQLAGQEWDASMGLSAMNLGQMNTNRQQSLQDYLGYTGANLDQNKFTESKSQFNKNYGLDFLRYLAQKEQFGQTLGENKRQHNNQQGFNWASLSAQQQQQLMATILGAF